MNEQLEVAILNNIGSTLQFIKNQQWKVSHYTLLIYGAIIAIQRHFDFEGENVALIGLAFIVFIASFIINQKLNKSLDDHRRYTTKIYEGNKDQIESYGIPINQTLDIDIISLILFCIATIGFVITVLIVVTHS